MTDRPGMFGRFFCTRSPPRLLPRLFSLVIRLRANRAAVRQFVQAFPPVILGLTQNPGRCHARYCIAPVSIPAIAPQGAGSEAGMTVLLHRLYCRHHWRRCVQRLYNALFVSSSRLCRRGQKNGERCRVAPRRGYVRSSAFSGALLRTCLQRSCAACP